MVSVWKNEWRHYTCQTVPRYAKVPNGNKEDSLKYISSNFKGILFAFTVQWGILKNRNRPSKLTGPWGTRSTISEKKPNWGRIHRRYRAQNHVSNDDIKRVKRCPRQWFEHKQPEGLGKQWNSWNGVLHIVNDISGKQAVLNLSNAVCSTYASVSIRLPNLSSTASSKSLEAAQRGKVSADSLRACRMELDRVEKETRTLITM